MAYPGFRPNAGPTALRNQRRLLEQVFDYSYPTTTGWLSIYLTRIPKIGRLRSMWKLQPPATLAAVSAFMPDPPALYLQAVNRASTY